MLRSFFHLCPQASYTVRLGYLVSIVGSAVLTMFPLRTALADLILPMFAQSGQYTLDMIFVPLTLGILAFGYLMAVIVPSIWIVISLVGSVSATGVGFVFPSIIVWQYHSGSSSKLSWWRCFAMFTLAMGVLIFIDGFITLYFKMQEQSQGNNAGVTLRTSAANTLITLFAPAR